MNRYTGKTTRANGGGKAIGSKGTNGPKPTLIDFVVSSGKKIALIVGINYTGSSYALNGCVNDALSLSTFLKSTFGFNDSNIKLLTDETDEKPTKANIMKYITEYITGDFDSVWISYSGHGTYTLDKNGDENDKRDEQICPIDFETAGFILDDTLNDILATGMKDDKRCFFLFDSCHSGTMVDLKYRLFDGSNTIVESKKEIKGNVVSISGCKDVQTSADAYIDGKWAGAMTTAFLNSASKTKNKTFNNIVKNMVLYLKNNKFSQVPLLCSCTLLTNRDIFTV